MRFQYVVFVGRFPVVDDFAAYRFPPYVHCSPVEYVCEASYAGMVSRVLTCPWTTATLASTEPGTEASASIKSIRVFRAVASSLVVMDPARTSNA
jgi:hypothetical protein